MHIKLRIHLNGRPSLVAGLVLALVATWHSQPGRATSSASSLERKCHPILNFGLPAQAETALRSGNKATTKSERSTTSTSNDNNERQQQQKLSQSIPDSFSFSIGDIDLPLAQAEGATGGGGGSTVQTAMKLLAAFDSQLYGESEAGDEGEGDDDESSGVQEQAPRESAIRFTGNKLAISGLNFTMLNVHLYPNGEPRFALGVNIANTTLTGRFLYDGPTPSLIAGDHSKLAAHYRMTIEDVLVTAASNLTKVFEPQASLRFPGEHNRYRLATSELRMNISNLGYISIDILDAEDARRPTSNYALKMLQRVMQKTIKRTYTKFEEYIRRTLELEGRRFIDCELSRFSPLLVENNSPPVVVSGSGDGAHGEQATSLSYKATAALGPLVVAETTKITTTTTSANSSLGLNATYLDDVARIISTEMAISHLDTIGLPDFDYQRSLFGSVAHIQFTNGSLGGLNNIKLTGETRVKLLEEHLFVNASVGWVNLRPHYNWTLYFGGGPQPVGDLTADRRLAQVASHAVGAPNQLAVGGGGSSASEQPPQQLSSAKSKRAPMASGFVAFNIKAIDFDATVSRSVRSQSQMVVDELTIRRLDGPKMDIGGLPGMNRLTRGVVNFFMGRLKQRLVGSIQPALKRELERTLNRMAMFN